MVHIPIDDQVLENVCRDLVHTKMEVVDVLSTLPVNNYESPYYEQALLDREILERCPLCEHWVWSHYLEWNQYKGCCTHCGEQDD